MPKLDFFLQNFVEKNDSDWQLIFLTVQEVRIGIEYFLGNIFLKFHVKKKIMKTVE